MKAIILALLAPCFLFACKSEPTVSTPEAVVAKFNELYPGASDVTWEREDSLYEASFKSDTTAKSVAFFADGTIHVMETDISAALLPQLIKDYIAQQAAGKTIDGATMIIFADGVTQYEAEVGDQDYLFDAAGQFVSVEVEESPSEKNE